MKEFNGSIIITDPMYISKDQDWMEMKGFNMKKKKINPDFGFTNYVILDTGIGRINQTLHRIENIKEFFQNQKEYIKDCLNKAYLGDIKPNIGNISSDSGFLGVYLKEDIERYNPDWTKNEEYYTELDFHGKIGVYTDSYGGIHFYGIGNVNFYTL